MSFLDSILKLFTGTIERKSPGDWLQEEAVNLWAQAIPWEKLNVKLDSPPRVWVPMIPDTNSMDGLFDFGNNNILIAGSNDNDHQKLIDRLVEGDIAVYKTTKVYAIHRIVKIGVEGGDRYFKFKGDNNPTADPDKVRASQIQWVSIGTIY